MKAHEPKVNVMLALEGPLSQRILLCAMALPLFAAVSLLALLGGAIAHAETPERERTTSRRASSPLATLPPVTELYVAPNEFGLPQRAAAIDAGSFVIEGDPAPQQNSLVSLLQEAPNPDGTTLSQFAVDDLPPSPLRPAQPASQVGDGTGTFSVEREIAELKKRLEELDTERQANEDATRSIIRSTLSEQGSGINDYVTLGGTIEALVFVEEDFDGNEQSAVVLDTAELDFEIRMNDWSSGSLVFEYFDGQDFIFATGDEDFRFVDRVNVRQAYITIGDPFKCPPYMTIGRDVLPFGISTGDPVTDVLSINDPLTVEVFEMQEDFILFGIAFPTPPPPPLPVAAYDRPGATGAIDRSQGLPGAPADTAAATAPGASNAYAPVGPPHVEPVLFAPIAHALGSKVCKYCGCYPVTPHPAWTPWIEYPHFNAAVYFFNGETRNEITDDDRMEHWGATAGYRSRGCLWGIPYSIDADVDFNSSVFDSNFLQYEYRRFLDEIGYVPGMAAHMKNSFGPFALVLEWNAAIDNADFIDQAIDLTNPLVPVVGPGNAISIRPEAWQVSLAYQLNYNEWLEIIGSEGTYIVVGYSESKDLAGVNRVLVDENGILTDDRVGFVPEKRFTIGFGEWVMYGTRVAFEYAHNVDYDVDEGGTGNSADGVFAQFTYEW